MRCVLLAVALNIVLDPLVIAGFGLGIEGAAYATIAAQGSAFLEGAVYVLYRQLAPCTSPTVASWEQARLIVTFGIPSGLDVAVISAGSAAIVSVVTG